MKKLLFLSCAFFLAATLHAQQLNPQVIASDGSCYFDNEIMLSLSWTLGEIVTDSYTTSGMILEQGFHHGDLLITGLEPEQKLLPGLSVYPNPAEHFININFGGELENLMYLEIISLNGSLFLQKEIQAGTRLCETDLSGLAQGIYFLRFKQKDKPYIKTHQIVKISK